jgi:hypothetical protein
MKSQNLIHILMAIVCIALSPQMQALSPPPDGGYPNGNTAEGDGALSGLTGGFYNSAVGFLSLLSNADASFNTGVGAGTLLVNTANENTATGAGALFSNTIGDQNTANGAFALFNNTEGDENTAVGDSALLTNTTGVANTAVGGVTMVNNVGGSFNVAIGDSALNNADSVFNTAVGFSAGQGPITGFDNIYLGDTAGTLDLDGNPVPDESQTTRIGSLFTEGGLAGAGRCFIGGIRNNGQVWNGVTVCQVTISIDGQLGVDCVNPDHPGGFNQSAPQASVPRSAPQQPAARPQFQAMNDKVEKLQATVAQQQKQIETLTAQLGEQAAQIQKVSAQLEASEPAPQVVNNDH